jgi:RNA polymerase sigma factor (sigma-70 family)
MAKPVFGNVLDYLRTVCQAGVACDLTDAELLHRFLAQREETAFSLLVQRHGPMVHGVCRRVLGDRHAAEDAFQATFLVLVRRAAGLRCTGSLANWLYGVAQRVAIKARSRRASGRGGERQIDDMSRGEPIDDVTWRELKDIVDEEISRLADKYRAPVVLCYLEDKSYDQAARELGWSKSSLAKRLTRARELLRRQLVRRGVGLSAGAVATALCERAAAAHVPALLTIKTVKAAALVAAGKAVVGGCLSAGALTLAEEGAAIFGAKVKMVLLAIGFGLAISGAGWAGYSGLAKQRQPAGAAAQQFLLRTGTRFQRGAGGNSVASPTIGSGRSATKSWDIAGFTEVRVHDGFRAEITQGDSFKITISSDDNLMEYVQVFREGNALTMRLAADANLTPKQPLTAAIVLPTLHALTLRDLSSVSLKGVRSEGNFKLLLADVSKVEGTLDVGSADFEIRDASTLALTGTASSARLLARDGSHLRLQNFILKRCTLKLVDACDAQLTVKSDEPFSASVVNASRLEGSVEAGELDLKLTQASDANLRGSTKYAAIKADEVCAADLSRFSAGDAEITLAGSSRAAIGVKKSLKYVVSSDSRLDYSGDPASVTESKSSGATIRRRP